MRKTITAAVFLGGLLLVAAPAGCFFDLADDCNFNMNLACYYDNQGGSGGSGGGSPECIPSATNKQIDETCGAFVSPTGSDANGDGTKANPYLTLKKAAEEKARVYACANLDKPFDGAVEPAADVVFYGGFDCADLDWPYDPTKKSAWTAPSDTIPLTLSGGIKVEVYDFAITARDAVMAGGSSVAVLASGDKTELVLERCDVAAGAGKDGVTPEKPSGTGTPGTAGKNGADGCLDATSKLGGDAGTNMCDGTSRNGGNGGNGTSGDGSQGSDGQPQPGPMPTDGKGGSGQLAPNGSCTTGGQGANGANGTPGMGATGIGTLTSTGYSGATGSDGLSDGTPGQGGGGGGGAKACVGPNVGKAGPGGGGGGAGGCPGTQPGKGGGPGGASIGIASVGALMTLNEVQITTNKGGAGGTGGDGQSGGKGGTAGVAGSDGGDSESKACSGGDGGKGGDAGPGGGGQGGHSVALAFTGNTPKQTKVVLSPGVAGGGGVAGAKNMDAGTKGASGLACQTLHFDDGTCE